MVYFITLGYLLYLIYKYDICNANNNKEKHYILLFLLFVSIAGLSYRLGIDSIRFDSFFSDYDNENSFKVFFSSDVFEAGKEPIWVLLNYAFSHLFHESQVLKCTINICFNLVVFWFIKKYSPLPFITLLIYAIFQFFQFNFEILRESIAILFFLIALDKILGTEKNYLMYYVWIIPSILVHHFAFIALIIPLFTFINNDKVYYFLLAILFFVSPIINKYLMTFIFFLSDEDLLMRLAQYSEHDLYGFRSINIFGYIQMFLLELLPFLILLTYGQNKSCKAMGFAYVFFRAFQGVSLSIFFRVNNYLFFPMAIALTEGVEYCILKFGRNQQLKQFRMPKYFFVITFLFILINKTTQIITRDSIVMYYPYSSIISKEKDPVREAYYINILNWEY